MGGPAIIFRVLLLVSTAALVLCCLSVRAVASGPQENPFPLLPGLEDSIEFWKQAFTRYGSSEVIFHDPLQPMKIYKVIRVDEEGAARAAIIKAEREKILKEHGFAEDEKRVRSQSGVRDRFAAGIKQSRKYLGQMQRIFREEGLPVELAYLPLVESSFNIHARSRAGALGMWQFMLSTGRRFLHIGSGVDERRDPLDSTRAAARFLKENYDLLGNWPLAITAYNHGRMGMLRAIEQAGSRDLMDIIGRYQGATFGFASKSFYAEFLAALEIAQNWEQHFPGLDMHPPFPLGEMELAHAVLIADLLRPTDVSRSDFLKWNPAVEGKVKQLPKGYRVKVPPEKLESFVSAYQRLAEAPASKGKGRPAARKVSVPRHRVTAGETLSEIAQRYRRPVHEIKKVNNLSGSQIFPGQYLKIPRP